MTALFSIINFKCCIYNVSTPGHRSLFPVAYPVVCEGDLTKCFLFTEVLSSVCISLPVLFLNRCFLLVMYQQSAKTLNVTFYKICTRQILRHLSCGVH